MAEALKNSIAFVAIASARSIGEQPMSDVGKAVTKQEFNDAVCR
jgi:hypothetical protein